MARFRGRTHDLRPRVRCWKSARRGRGAAWGRGRLQQPTEQEREPADEQFQELASACLNSPSTGRGLSISRGEHRLARVLELLRPGQVERLQLFNHGVKSPGGQRRRARHGASRERGGVEVLLPAPAFNLGRAEVAGEIMAPVGSGLAHRGGARRLGADVRDRARNQPAVR